MHPTLALLLIVLVAAGWAAMGGLLASLWQDGLNLAARRHSPDARPKP